MNKFQRILLASGLAASASLMGNSAVFAGTTGTVNLSGTVTSSLTITVTPTATATALNLAPGTNLTFATSNMAKIATITSLSTNSANGLKVVASTSGTLVSGANSIAVTSYGSAGVATAVVPTGSSLLSTFTAANGYIVTSAAGSAPDYAIFIGYTVPANQPQGIYTGSITFTAVDN
jgi:hypothetical protein